jgi:hypothetical protein
VAGGQEQGGAGADVGGDQVRRAESEFTDQLNQELGHGAGREQVCPAFRVPEAGQVDGYQPGASGKRRPNTPERQQAFWPRAGQQDVRPVGSVGVGVPDGQAVDLSGTRSRRHRVAVHEWPLPCAARPAGQRGELPGAEGRCR